MERITAGDDVSSLEITWFNNPYAAQKLELGQEYYFQGIVTGGMLRRQMVNPQVRTDVQVKSSPFEAVYPQTEGLTSSAIAKCVRQLLPHAELLPDPLPSEMLKKYRLLSKADAVRAIHCPATEEEAFAARRRLIYEELLVLQLGIGRMKNHGAASTGAPMKKADVSPFWESLPLLPHRRTAAGRGRDPDRHVGRNVHEPPLQGDVGSGKRWWRLRPSGPASGPGIRPHCWPHRDPGRPARRKPEPPALPFGMRAALLTGGMKAAARRTTLAAIRDDEADLIVGTTPSSARAWSSPGWVWPSWTNSTASVCASGACWPKRPRTPHLLVMSAHPTPPDAGAADVRRPRHLHPRRAAAGPQRPSTTRCIHRTKRPGRPLRASLIEKLVPDDRCISSALPLRTRAAAA